MFQFDYVLPIPHRATIGRVHVRVNAVLVLLRVNEVDQSKQRLDSRVRKRRRMEGCITLFASSEAALAISSLVGVMELHAARGGFAWS